VKQKKMRDKGIRF